jgi:hypothetical protein
MHGYPVNPDPSRRVGGRMPDPYLHLNHRPIPAIVNKHSAVGVRELNCSVPALSSTRERRGIRSSLRLRRIIDEWCKSRQHQHRSQGHHQNDSDEWEYLPTIKDTGIGTCVIHQIPHRLSCRRGSR